ncbi:DUF3558 domain-containing protein [Nocardia nova]|nr:DUF3558 domain-containing protein [Nocardia nova]
MMLLPACGTAVNTTPPTTAVGNPLKTAPTIAMGNPSTTTAPITESVWDACSLSESALSAAGVDTSSKTRVADAGNPAARVCKWQSADQSYELVVTASDKALDDQLASGKYNDVRRTQYYGRDVVVFRAVQDTNKLGCYTGTPAAFGSIVLTVRNAHVQTGEGEPCAEANRLGAALLRSLR